jgi:hypothetical protein
MFWPMALVSSIKLSDEEKLAILRRLDQFRQWRSLDEKRYCLVLRQNYYRPGNPGDYGRT